MPTVIQMKSESDRRRDRYPKEICRDAAYQVSGPLDILFSAGSTPTIELRWDEPGFVRFAQPLVASVARSGRVQSVAGLRRQTRRTFRRKDRRCQRDGGARRRV
jgi:hypothetical protein